MEPNSRFNNISLVPLVVGCDVGGNVKVKQLLGSDVWPGHVFIDSKSRGELGVKISSVADDFRPKFVSEWISVQEEGGLRGWMTVAGAWLIQFSTFGSINSFGVYEDFYTLVLLRSHSPSSIAWIGSFQLMMPFALGLISGKLFDAGYFHHLVISGSVIFTFSLFMLSFAQPNHYYQIFLSQGLGIGIGVGLVFVPTVSICAHHFKRRKALATGIVFSGSSAGGTVFPIMLNHLLVSKGYANAVRDTGYIVLGCLIIGNLLMRKPLPINTPKPPPPNIASFFKEPEYLMTIFGCFLMFFGIFFPIVYLQLYAVLHNVDGNLASYSLAILNACSFVGRISGNFFADNYGAWNLLIPVTAITGGTIWAVLGVHNATTLVIVAMTYGFFSGTCLSLLFAALGSFAQSPNEIGARTGLVLAIASFGRLLAAPTQGALLSRTFLWIRPIALSSTSLFVAALIAVLVRNRVAAKKGLARV